MTKKIKNEFFDDINFASIVDNIKGIYTSNGSMSYLLDFERVLDEADIYAFKNWELGELVQGPEIGRYTVTCTFMWPYKLMPDPRAIKRLLNIGCNVDVATSTIKVPVKVESPDDFISGTRYPKSKEIKVWYFKIEIPQELTNDIKEGTMDLADKTIDLSDIEDAYDDDLDDSTIQDEDNAEAQAQQPEEGQV